MISIGVNLGGREQLRIDELLRATMRFTLRGTWLFGLKATTRTG